MSSHVEDAAERGLQRIERMKKVNRLIAVIGCALAVAAIVLALTFSLTSQSSDISRECRQTNELRIDTGKYIVGLLSQNEQFIVAQTRNIPDSERPLLQKELDLYNSEINNARATFKPVDCS